MNVERKEKGCFFLLSLLQPSKIFNNFSYSHKSFWNVPVCSLLSLFFLYFFFQLMPVFKSRRKKEQSFVPLYPAFQLCSLLFVIFAMTTSKNTFIYLLLLLPLFNPLLVTAFSLVLQIYVFLSVVFVVKIIYQSSQVKV